MAGFADLSDKSLMTAVVKTGAPLWVGQGLTAERTRRFGAVCKDIPEHRYTLGPLHVPGVIDTQGDVSSPAVLQDALWDLLKKGRTEVFRSHDKAAICGHIVDGVCWPLPFDGVLGVPGGEYVGTKFPAGTPFVGVKWAEEAWRDVCAGKLTGLSMGGRAIRVEADFG